VTEKTGMSVEEIETLALTVSEPGKRVSWWWTMGINQSYEGVRAAQAMINLALITGNIGKPGTGANSITGQCNAMGSRLFSNTTSLVGGHDFAVPEHREKVSAQLGVPLENIPTETSFAYDQIFDAVEAGTIKALWVIATNPFHSWIDQERLMRLREKLDFLVVQDMYHSTETARMADLVLPAAGWGEKNGCFINSERRIATTKTVKKAPGIALSDFRIFRLIANAWGCGEMFAKWTDPEAAFKILRDLTKGRPCDITAINGYDHLDEAGGIQWPYTAPVMQERRLFEDGKFYHPDGKARLLFSHPAQLPESSDAEYPFTLLTGRGTSSQWHTQSRTAKSPVLRKLAPSNAYVEMHPEDASALSLSDHEMVSIRSRRGEMQATVYLAPTMQRGQVFIPMHYPELNRLTHPSFDPHSRQPNYKACAVVISGNESK
jgi:anaerobic selenocysteine-containing dehydrogenase